MDYRDSPAEAEFRANLRAWLADNNPGLPPSSTDHVKVGGNVKAPPN